MTLVCLRRERTCPMDAHRFDALARALAPGATRRRALAGLVGGVLAVVAPAAAGRGAAARRRRNKRKKRKKTWRCEPHCAAAKPCGPDGCGGTCGTCQDPETCQGGTCVCVPDCGGGALCGVDDGCGTACECDEQAF